MDLIPLVSWIVDVTTQNNIQRNFVKLFSTKCKWTGLSSSFPTTLNFRLNKLLCFIKPIAYLTLLQMEQTTLRTTENVLRIQIYSAIIHYDNVKDLNIINSHSAYFKWAAMIINEKSI